MNLNRNKIYFQPSILGFLFNPHFIIRYNLYINIKKLSKQLKGKLLDLGCGSKPYENLFNVTEYVGVDIEVSGHPHEDSKVDVFYDGKVLPFADSSFDCIFSGEVFEHVFNLQEILLELNRVLKKDGFMLFTTPFVWEEHEIPYDFGRYSIFALEYLLKESGFEIITNIKSTHYLSTIIQLFISYWHNILPLPKVMKKVFNFFITFPLTIIGLIIPYIFPKNEKLFLNHVILVKKV